MPVSPRRFLFWPVIRSTTYFNCQAPYRYEVTAAWTLQVLHSRYYIDNSGSNIVTGLGRQRWTMRWSLQRPHLLAPRDTPASSFRYAQWSPQTRSDSLDG